ncbi:Cupin domain protein [Ruaniaceae bacterium KH17]|nr:Cupin domain protein [Ruaniaceae bacterium KH17]
MIDLASIVEDYLVEARAAPNGRHAKLVAHDGELRQTVIALRKGTRLAEHNSPPAATIVVFEGRLQIECGQNAPEEIQEGKLWVLTHERHAVTALTDCVFMLTTVTSVGEGSHGG